MGSKTDFHIHTDYSDGAYTPTEIVKKFKKEEYDIIAITDHDGIGGIAEAKIAGEALEITVVPGIEFSTFIAKDFAAEAGMDIEECEELTAHLLGYHFNTEDVNLGKAIEFSRESRHKRNEMLLLELNKMGYSITYDELLKERRTGYIGKPVIARLMVKKGYIPSVEEAFEEGKIFESPQIKSIYREKLNIVDAISVINNAGGISVLAHPMKIRKIGKRGSDDFWTNMDRLLRALKKSGLKGMECFHSNHTHEEALRLVSLAEKYHLHVTNGSDFHDDPKPVVR